MQCPDRCDKENLVLLNLPRPLGLPHPTATTPPGHIQEPHLHASSLHVGALAGVPNQLSHLSQDALGSTAHKGSHHYWPGVSTGECYLDS